MAKILILTPQLPYPPQQGTSLRNYHIIQGLAAQHEITLLSFLEDNQTAVPTQIAPLADKCQRIETVPVPSRSAGTRLRQLVTTRLPDMAHRLASPVFTSRLRQLLTESDVDIVQIEGIELAHTIDVVRIANKSGQNKINIVFDDHNAETELQRRNMYTDWRQPRRWLAAAYSGVQVGRLRSYECWAGEQADWVTAVSETDKKHLQALGFQTPVTVIPNCIDTSAYAPPPDGPSENVYDLVFSGKMDYRPNVDAVLWFADAVWPMIKAARPSATWAIVGQKPHPRLNRLRQVAGITITGWVADIRPYLFGAQVFIMPLRVGSGTRLKLIEAFAAGKAVVSTQVGAEGFPVTHGQELIVADSAQAMGTAVVRLLENPQERTHLSRAAQQFAAHYDWRVIVPQFNQIYANLLTF